MLSKRLKIVLVFFILLVVGASLVHERTEESATLVHERTEESATLVYPDYVTLAVEDAAYRVGVGIGDVIVITFGPVTWPDGALGCPQPGMMYTQALVDGYRVVLGIEGIEHETRLLHYHGGGGGKPFLCTDIQSSS